MRTPWRSLAPLAAASLVLGAVAAALAGAETELLVARYSRLARDGPWARSAAAMAKLRRLGPRGWRELVELARDGRPLPCVAGPHAALVPPDRVADLALDALRHLREGREMPRPFAWSLADEAGLGYEEALERFRAEELARALEWIESRRSR